MELAHIKLMIKQLMTSNPGVAFHPGNRSAKAGDSVENVLK
jgi:hypothetical protein